MTYTQGQKCSSIFGQLAQVSIYISNTEIEKVKKVTLKVFWHNLVIHMFCTALDYRILFCFLSISPTENSALFLPLGLSSSETKELSACCRSPSQGLTDFHKWRPPRTMRFHQSWEEKWKRREQITAWLRASAKNAKLEQPSSPKQITYVSVLGIVL